MKKSYAQKIQTLLISHLLNLGKIELLLPDGVSLEIGILKEGKHGSEISDDYCYVKSSREGSSVMLDTYNLSLEYNNDKTLVSFDDQQDNGQSVRCLSVF